MSFSLDLRHSLRSWRRSPAMLLGATAAIGIGIGASTTVFGWLDNLVLHPFPAVRAPGRIVGVETLDPSGEATPVSYPAFREWRAEARASSMAAWTIVRVTMRRGEAEDGRTVIAMPVSGDYFATLTGPAAAGRLLDPQDESGRAPVAVLGHRAWLRDFDADPRVIGEVLHLNGEPVEVVGVAPARFRGTYLGIVPDLYVATTLQPRLTGVDPLEDRSARAFQVVARLRPGVPVSDAQQELDALARRLSAAAGERPPRGALITDARRRYLGGLVYPVLAATLAVTTLLLGIGCANVSGLLLVRGARRAGELSLRRAVGASAAGLWRVVLVDTLPVTCLGSALGLLIAYASRDALYAFLPATAFTLNLDLPMSWRVLVFAVGTSALAGALSVVSPALRAAAASPATVLRGGIQPGSALAGTSPRLAMTAAQVALSLACLVTSGFFLRWLSSAATLDTGFRDPGRVLLVDTDLAPAHLDGAAAATALRELLQRIRSLPGVEEATAASFVPLSFGGRRVTPVVVEGRPAQNDEETTALRVRAGSRYAATMGIDLIAGRDFDDRDREDSAPVALVNETFRRRFLADGEALGHRIDAGSGWASVVGVLRDGKYEELSEPPRAVVYLPLVQSPQPTLTVHVRTRIDPLELAEAVRAALRSVHADLPALQVRSLKEHISAASFVPRVGSTLAGTLGVAAVVLTLVGLHAALASAVALRRRELALRRAMGAGVREVLVVVARPAFRSVCIGLAAGAALSVPLVQRLRMLLPAPSQSAGWLDAGLIAGAALPLLAVAALSSCAPAVRALRIDPARALRDA